MSAHGVAMPRWRAAVVTVAGLIGLAAALVLSIEKYQLLVNPFYRPSCSVNEKVNCTAVMQSEQSALLGFPNPYLGLIGFAIVLTIGVAALAGTRFPGWIWKGLSLGILAGLALVAWLAYQSIVVIEALCPYCMAVWVVTIVLAAVVWPFALRRSPSR